VPHVGEARMSLIESGEYPLKNNELNPKAQLAKANATVVYRYDGMPCYLESCFTRVTLLQTEKYE